MNHSPQIIGGLQNNLSDFSIAITASKTLVLDNIKYYRSEHLLKRLEYSASPSRD